jgi:hypothetical protein
MEEKRIKLKNSSSIIYLICFIVIMGVSIFFAIIDMQDMNNVNYWLILYIFSIAISIYYIIIYGIDIFNEDAGFFINESGLTLDFEYFKKLHIPWNDISDFRFEKSMISIIVYNPDKYLEKIHKISALLIKGNIKRMGTFFFIRTNQFHIDKLELEESLKNAYQKYSKVENTEEEEKD